MGTPLRNDSSDLLQEQQRVHRTPQRNGCDNMRLTSLACQCQLPSASQGPGEDPTSAEEAQGPKLLEFVPEGLGDTSKSYEL